MSIDARFRAHEADEPTVDYELHKRAVVTNVVIGLLATLLLVVLSLALWARFG